jgi:GxxExxY protein
MQYHPLTATIIGCAMKVHSTLGPGFLESVYQNALVHELNKASLNVRVQHPLPVYYDAVRVGEFVADLLVNDVVVVELKALQTLVPAHEMQLVNYLSATGVDIGVLLNFGAPRLQFKRKPEFLSRARTRKTLNKYPVHPSYPVILSKKEKTRGPKPSGLNFCRCFVFA